MTENLEVTDLTGGEVAKPKTTKASVSKKKATTGTSAKGKVTKDSEAGVGKEVVSNPIVAAVDDVETLLEDVKSSAGSLLENVSVDELRQLRIDALWAESELKRKLHLLRLRAANMATTAQDDADREIIEVKAELAKAAEWLHSVEAKLEGEFKDLTGIRF